MIFVLILCVLGSQLEEEIYCKGELCLTYFESPPSAGSTERSWEIQPVELFTVYFILTTTLTGGYCYAKFTDKKGISVYTPWNIRSLRAEILHL